MRRTPPRDSEGRFLGHRDVLEFIPRLSAREVGRALEDPRRCAYRLDWRAEDSLPATYGFPGLEAVSGFLEPAGEAVRVVPPLGRPVVVNVLRRPLSRGGWWLVFRCPACLRGTRYLYVRAGALWCRGCAWLRYRSEGHFRRRLERRLGFAISDHPWTARLSPQPGRPATGAQSTPNRSFASHLSSRRLAC